MIKVDISYQVVTLESSRHSGLVASNEVFDNISELVEYVKNNYGCLEHGNGTTFYTANPEIDLGGSETTYGIRFNSKRAASMFWKSLRGQE